MLRDIRIALRRPILAVVKRGRNNLRSNSVAIQSAGRGRRMPCSLAKNLS